MAALNIRFVVFRYGHHSPHSGYSRLAEYGVKHFDGEVIRVGKPLSRTIVRDRVLWRIAKGTPGYDRSSMAAELKVMWDLISERHQIYHFLYGETTYHYAGKLNNYKQNRIVATFHLPPDGIRESVQINWHIKQLSAVICVGSSQQEFFADIFDRDRIFFVPLGIDTQFYTPPVDFETRNPDLCLVVGENYRDFPTLRGMIELVSYMRPKTQFVVVTSPGSYDLIGRHPNLSLRSGISEADLLNLYRSAALMVTPLKNTTANNALLESMACGLPVITSDVGSVRDYVNSQCAVLVPPCDARKMADSVLQLLDDPCERQKMSEKAREQSLKFAWPEIMKILETVYAAIA